MALQANKSSADKLSAENNLTLIAARKVMGQRTGNEACFQYSKIIEWNVVAA